MDRLIPSVPATINFDEVIDLTIDSPITSLLNSRAFAAQARLPRRGEPTDSLQNWYRTLDSAVRSHPSFYQRYDNVPAEQDDSSIQVIDPDEPLSIIHLPDDAEKPRDIAEEKPAEEYSTAIPCIHSESINEELHRLCCPICFEPLIAKQKPTTTRCGHIFCAECLKQSLQATRNKTCPICNAPVKIKSCIRLHFL